MNAVASGAGRPRPQSIAFIHYFKFFSLGIKPTLPQKTNGLPTKRGQKRMAPLTVGIPILLP